MLKGDFSIHILNISIKIGGKVKKKAFRYSQKKYFHVVLTNQPQNVLYILYVDVQVELNESNMWFNILF